MVHTRERGGVHKPSPKLLHFVEPVLGDDMGMGAQRESPHLTDVSNRRLYMK